MYSNDHCPLIGIATVDSAEIAEGAVYELLNSVDHAVMRILIVGRAISDEESRTLAEHPATLDIVRIGQAGLSSARNAGIRCVLQRGIPTDIIVAFPDDDCIYPVGLPSRVLDSVGTDEIVLGTYDEDPQSTQLSPRTLTFRDVYRHGNSVGIFVRLGLAVRVGGFDERLGVGSGDVSAGEDIEFIARCLDRGARGRFDPNLVVRHPRRKPPAERSGAYLAVAIRYRRHVESWVRIVKAVAGSILGLSPIPRKRLFHLLRPRRRVGLQFPVR